MRYDLETLSKLDNFIDDYLKEQFEKYVGLNGRDTILDKIEHINRAATITKMIAPGNKMAEVAAKFHDIGRFPQYEILGGFRDDLILHHNLGEDLITRFLFQKKLEPSFELDVIRQSVMYHGRMQFIPFKKMPMDPEILETTEIISRSDDLDNGCVGALGYLEREVLTDAKGYKEKNPDLDMTMVSPSVIEHYRKGEKFDKLKECKTYADYILFATVLAIQSLKGKDHEVAKKLMAIECYGYDNALEGYKDLFNKYVEPAYAKEAYDILLNFYNMDRTIKETEGREM